MSGKILTMQDLSCVGQCSLTVALPILSAYGWETCVLPTAILSNHTAFKTWSYLDLTPEISGIFDNWTANGLKFDAFLLGYLGKEALMERAEECFDRFAKERATIIIDPVFGDNGRLYGGFDVSYVEAMRHLIRRAHVILPNVTEACFLAGVDYRSDYDRGFVETLIDRLKKHTDATVIVTGVETDGRIGEVIQTNDRSVSLQFEKLPQSRHGTGDVFSSVFTAHLLAGHTLEQSCTAASEFVMDCIRCTGEGHFYGVEFEKVLERKGNR